MFSVFDSQIASSLVLPLAAGAADTTAAAQATPILFVIAATILVAVALRTATRAVASIVAQIVRAIVPASMAALMLLAAFALVVIVAVNQIL
jgi:hypothetical protein